MKTVAGQRAYPYARQVPEVIKNTFKRQSLRVRMVYLCACPHASLHVNICVRLHINLHRITI